MTRLPNLLFVFCVVLLPVIDGSAQTVRVISPNGGEVFGIARTYEIRWTSTGVTGNARIDLSLNGGFSFVPIDSNLLNTGTYQWTIFSFPTSAARIRVTVGRVGGAIASDMSDNNFTISSLEVVAPPIVHMSDSITVIAGIPPNFIPLRSILYYRKGGKTAYDSLSMLRAGQHLQARIPDSVLTERGVEYFIRVSDIEGSLTFPDFNPQFYPAIIRVRIGRLVSPLQMERRMYRMVSIPLENQDSTLEAILADDYGEYDMAQWRLFRWEQHRNREYPNIAARFVPGKAFWLTTRSGSSFDTEAGISVSTKEWFEIQLDSGWNQIANPFPFPVTWQSVERKGTIKGPYFFDGSNYRLDTAGAILPWEGYFVLNEDPFSAYLYVPPIESGGQPRLGKRQNLESSFTLQLSARVRQTEFHDPNNYIGFRELALEGHDSYDYPEPPSIDDNVQLSVVQDGTRYMYNFKRPTSEGATWECEIISPAPGRPIDLHLTTSGTLPESFEVFVFDLDDHHVIPVVEGNFVVESPRAHQVKRLRLVIGTEKYAEARSQGIPLVPIEYSLEQNFPNPFNSSTTIRYQLGKKSVVAIDIYDLLGRHVRRLVHDLQLTGVHTVVWDGKNDVGIEVGTGIYFYRIQAAAFVATRKLMVLR